MLVTPMLVAPTGIGGWRRSRHRATLLRRVALPLLIASLAAPEITMAVETPQYTVTATLAENVEIRRYAPMLLAEVGVEGDRGQAVGRAFRVLADFIFGNNDPGAKIAMTAPVLQSADKDAMPTNGRAAAQQATWDDGLWRVSFMMPAKYTADSLPVPANDRVEVRRSEPFDAVVLRFSGFHTDSNFRRHLQELDEAVAQHGLNTTGPALLAYYDAPFKPFFLRRNEVMYRLVPD